MYFEDLDNSSQLSADDIVLVIMGPTGAGKSNIIDKITGQDKRAGHGLQSCTSEVRCVRIRNHPERGDNIVLVDTPGFDDTQRSDMEILKIISEWLVKMYRARVFLSWIIYLHQITDIRMSGTHHLNLRMFCALCGEKAARNVLFVTTMWDCETKELGEEREEGLKKNHWHAMLECGASTARFDNTTKSGWEIIEELLARPVERVALKLQTEIFDLKRPLDMTEAVRVLHEPLLVILAEQSSTGHLANGLQGDMTSMQMDAVIGCDGYEEVMTTISQLTEGDIVIATMDRTGSGKTRFENTLQSTWKIINDLSARNREVVPLLLQQEMVDLKQPLNVTTAGRAIYMNLQALLTQQKITIRRLADQAKAKSDPMVAVDMNEEVRRIRQELEKIYEDINQLHVSFRRMIWILIGRKTKLASTHTF